MNPLGNGNLNTLSPMLMQGIQQVKNIMQMFCTNPAQLLQQNPMLNQVMQTYKGQNLEQVFMSMCKSQGINPEAILKELRS